jgi:hypothetical protein
LKLHDLVDVLSNLEDEEPTVGEDGLNMMLPAQAGRRLRMIYAIGALAADAAALRGWLRDMLPRLRAATPFSFEDITFVSEGHELLVPEIGPEGLDLFNSGAVAPPLDPIWLEYRLTKQRVGLLVWREGDEIHVRRFVDRFELSGSLRQTVYETRCFGVALRPSGPVRKLSYAIDDPFGAHRRTVAAFGLSDAEFPTEPGVWHDAVPGRQILLTTPEMFAIHLLLILRSNVRRIETDRPSLIVNRRRSAKGLSRIVEYRRVTMPGGWTPRAGFPNPIWG